jgi:hypothetical protein
VPGGPTELGFVYFSAVKLVGYTAAAWYFKSDYKKHDSSVWKIGAARTALGIAAGVSYGAAWWLLARWFHRFESWDLWYLALLIPIRIGEWALILWLFFERGSAGRSHLTRNVFLGTVWSYVLDAIGVFAAFVVPGGAWIC